MKISRKFTAAGSDPFASVAWVKRSSKISNPDGSVVFQMDDAEVPETWSQLATDIMVSKYFRKAGVPADGGPHGIKSEGVSGANGPEKSAKQVIHRLAGCWRHWGETHGYFDTAGDAQAFYDELVYMMVHQMCAPNSPQWFNTGLNWAYGITGPAQGHWVVNPKTGVPELADDAYSHPQPHACFIQSVSDDLVNEGGIMDLWVREARLFKYGSGTGTNFSRLRGEGEKLSGGGKSSGLMSWLRIGDRAASAIKSGGTTRRAAKMVCLDMDHPDILEFVNWKVREEIKVAAMVEGMKVLRKGSKDIAGTSDKLGLKLDYDYNGESYLTVSGQNSNNSVRIPDSFFDALDADSDWQTTWRITGKPARTMKATDLWGAIGYAAWRCADPGVQFDSTINAWHTCPGAGRINASNPCSEYMFLDNTACNLASLNVLKFYDPVARVFDSERYEHGIDLWTIVLEISVLMAAFPSKEIAELSYKYRTLGLGYANLGAMLMQAGIAYDSDEARAICAMLTATLTGRSYRLSALLAKEHGPFPGYKAERENMLRVIRNHRRAARGVTRESSEWEQLNPKTRPVPTDHAIIKSGKINLKNAGELLERSVKAWDEALSLGEKHGYRNAQVTVIAPTGTIGLLMDCDTTGVEPDFALVKFKKLAGGGYFKIANESVRPALKTLGYGEAQIRDIMHYLLGTLSLDVLLPEGVKMADGSAAPADMTLAQWLEARGVGKDDLRRITDSLPSVFELGFAFTGWSVADATLKAMGIDPDKARADFSFNLLRALGMNKAQVDALNVVICGTQTIEGAPQLKAEHLAVFDCANKCGKLGRRYIAAQGHIRMMAAAQPFISGAISKTINLPQEATEQDIKDCYRLSWELGLKANALYRDGCKLSQPLSSTADEAKSEVLNGDEEADERDVELAKTEIAGGVAAVADAVAKGNAQLAEAAKSDVIQRPMRRRLSDTRRSITHKFNVAGHEGYLTVGLYDDGQPGELFITMSKEGSTIGGLMDSLGTATSVALQYGVPVSSLVTKFSHQRFEPAGMTENSDIPFAKSLVDYIFRWMGMQFIPGYLEQNSPRAQMLAARAAEQAAAARMSGKEVGEWNTGSVGRSPRETDSIASPARKTDSHDAARVPATSPREVRVAESRSDLKVEIKAEASAAMKAEAKSDPRAATLSEALGEMSDAPACDGCGTITVRSGTCYKCLNCGASMGCS